MISNRSVVLLIYLSIIATGQSWGQNEQPHSRGIWNESRCEVLRERLAELHENKRFNGTVLIAENGVAKFHQSFGYSDIAAGTKLSDNSSFRLASVSKQFTAMAIMILAEQKKLDYDDPITEFLPSLPYDEVTIRNLLHHTSGLPDYMSLMNKHWDRGKKLADRKIAFNKDVVAAFAEHKPKLMFEPNSRYEYSNTGYVFLGQIIENASGIPVRKFIADHIFKPAGMSNSSVYSPTDDFKLQHRVFGFRHTRGKPAFVANDFHYLNGMVGDGGIYATANDLLKWDQALYGERIAKAATIEEAFQSGKLNDGSETGYGFGWVIDSQGGSKKFQVSHSGGWVGFSTFIGRNLTERRTLIILDNSSSGIASVLSAVSTVAKSKPPATTAKDE